MKERSVCCGRSLSSLCKNQSRTCSLEGRYIVERIIGGRRDDACFEGTLCIEGLPCSFCTPHALCRASVCDIRTVSRGCGCEKLRLLLCCLVSDAHGCRAEGTACIEIDVPACTGTVRRGAQVGIAYAQSCQPGCFETKLNVSVQTIVTQCELIGGREPCEPCCMPPLYPQPAKRIYRGGQCEHF